jgi:hypothetical protein
LIGLLVPHRSWSARTIAAENEIDCRRLEGAMTSVNFRGFLVGWSTRLVRRARYWPTLGAEYPAPLREELRHD